MLWRALRDVEKGFYVDIGASDPEVASATRAFYERGWSGINVQPLDEYFQKLVESRPRDKNLKVACRAGGGAPHFAGSPWNGAFASERGNRFRTQGARQPRRRDRCARAAPYPAHRESASSTIHFLKIDVEGDQAEVLEGLDLERVRPWIILIGTIDSEFYDWPPRQWEHLITERGYSLAHFDGLNCFYVADEIPGVKERLAVPPNFFDDFVRSQEQFNGQGAASLGTTWQFENIFDRTGNRPEGSVHPQCAPGETARGNAFRGRQAQRSPAGRTGTRELPAGTR